MISVIRVGLSAILTTLLAVSLARASSAQEYTFTTLAGLAEIGPGAKDGTGGEARFNGPSGLAFDRQGNLLVADRFNHTVRLLSHHGEVTTLAGLAGYMGGTDGSLSQARFNQPQGLTVDDHGNIYVAESANHTVRKITSDGRVSILAGYPGYAGTSDGKGMEAYFDSPVSVSVDQDGSVFVADTGNHAIRRISPDGVVTTVAGSAGASGSADGQGIQARFDFPSGILAGPAGKVYIADTFNHVIRMLSAEGLVTTLAGVAGEGGSQDGSNCVARLYYPCGLAMDEYGTLFVTEYFNSTIRRIGPDGMVNTITNLGGSLLKPEDMAAAFYYPSGIVVDKTGTLFVTSKANCIQSISPDGTLTTLAGSTNNPEEPDGHATTGRFANPAGLAMTAGDTLIVADSESHTIRSVTPDGTVTTLAGQAGAADITDGPGAQARFDCPMGVAVDSQGMIFVADTMNHTIRRISPDGMVSTFAGSGGNLGTADGLGSAARFNFPFGLTVDRSGRIFVADTYNHAIRLIDTNGLVTTYAGVLGQSGSADGPVNTAKFCSPTGVVVDSAANLFVVDSQNNSIRMIDPSGTNVISLAGAPGRPGGVDGLGRLARFDTPMSAVIDRDGNLLVADTMNCLLRQVTPMKEVTTIGGLLDAIGSTDGTGREARFNLPFSIAVDSAGNLFVSDFDNRILRKGTPAAPDAPRGDQTNGMVGQTRQLSIENQTGSSRLWSVRARPAGSRCELSDLVANDPFFIPDTPGLYLIELRATNSLNQISLRTISFTVDPLPAVTMRLDIKRVDDQLELRLLTEPVTNDYLGHFTVESASLMSTASTWRTLTNGWLSTNPITCLDPLDTNGLPRFYRARQIP